MRASLSACNIHTCVSCSSGGAWYARVLSAAVCGAGVYTSRLSLKCLPASTVCFASPLSCCGKGGKQQIKTAAVAWAVFVSHCQVLWRCQGGSACFKGMDWSCWHCRFSTTGVINTAYEMNLMTARICRAPSIISGPNVRAVAELPC